MTSNKFKALVIEAIEGESPPEDALFQLIKLMLRGDEFNYRKNFLLEGINSQKIVKLLAFLEQDNVKIRKLSLLFFALAVSNSKSKIYFLEKCGFGLSFGKVLFTRLKYLQNKLPSGNESAMIVRSFLYSITTSKRVDKSVLFWFISIATLDEQNIKVVNFQESIIESRLTPEYLLEVIPDPIENLCGFEFSELDFVEKELEMSIILKESMKPSLSISTDEIEFRTEPRKGPHNRLMVEKSTDFAEFKTKKESSRGPLDRSSAKKSRTNAMDVFQKYRSTIKDRTPSLNVRKDLKSNISALSNKASRSPIKTPKGQDSKTDMKNSKVSKVSEIIAKSKASKSPTQGENRTNITEKVNKILSSRNKI